MRAEFYPLSPGFYKISITSPNFEYYETIFKLTPENFFLNVFLNKKRQIIPVFDGNSVSISEFPIFEDETMESPGEFLMEPSSFFISEINKEMIVEIKFQKGPSGSTGILKFEDQDESSEFLIEVEQIQKIFCLKCGFKIKIKIVKNVLYVNQENPKCNIVILKIPFIYSVQGLKRDFKSSFEVVIDKRSSKTLEPRICGKS